MSRMERSVGKNINSFKLFSDQAYGTFADWLELFGKSTDGGHFRVLLTMHGTQMRLGIKVCEFSYMLPSFICSYDYFDWFCCKLCVPTYFVTDNMDVMAVCQTRRNVTVREHAVFH